MFELNKRYTVQAPQGAISDTGIGLVIQHIAMQRLHNDDWKVQNAACPHTYLYPLPDDWNWQWVVKGRGEYVGTFPKRVSKYYFKTYAIKCPNTFLQELGNLARQHSADSTAYHFEIVDSLQWEAGDFGDNGSCLWGSRDSARAIMEANGGLALCFYNDENKGYARSWLAKLNDNLYIVFNGYGFKSNPTLTIARVFAQFTGLSYKKIALSNNDATSGTIWINSSIGYIVGSADAIADYSRYDLQWHKKPGMLPDMLTCADCECDVHEDEIYYSPNDEPYCRDCFYERYDYCARCDEIEYRDSLYYIEHEGHEVCEHCLDSNYTRCDECDEYYRHHEITNLDNHALCQSCLEEYCEHCAKCEDLHHNSALTDGLCENCQPPQ
jgi:hypothetical protein